MRLSLILSALFLGMSYSSLEVCAQTQPVQPQPGQSLQNFPGAMTLDALVDSVSKQLEIRILYDDKITSKKINVRATDAVPNASMLGVLQSALRMNGLALVPADVPGWMKIVEVNQLPQSGIGIDAGAAFRRSGGSTPVTQAFHLKHADPTALAQNVKPFLTQGTGTTANVLALKDQKVLIITDYASNVLRLERLIEMMDKPIVDVDTRFIKAKHLDAETLANNLSQLMSARQKARSGGDQNTKGAVEVSFDERTNQLILVGDPFQVEQAEKYLQTLDVAIDTRTEVYNLTNIAASKIERLIKGMIEVRGTRPVFRSVVDDEQNLLVVTTTESIHHEITALLRRLDMGRESSGRKSPVRFYRLKHAMAEDVLRTIQELEGTETQAPGGDENRFGQQDGRFNLQPEGFPGGVEQPNVQLPNELLNRAGQLPLAANALTQRAADGLLFGRRAADAAVTGDSAAPITLAEAVGLARVTADSSSNTLIVIATPEVHLVYAELIEKLDQPRPQVLIEARLVIIDTSDDFTLGVEVSGGDRMGDQRLFAFTQFGFSQVDAVSGALSIIPGMGFNGTLVDPDVADVVLRAVSSHRRSKVISSPRLLVNDNATGRLTSVTEVPFNSFNTFNTVSSTSFAGYAEAGTTISVTPHISEDDQLQLEYSITLNEFQAEAGGDGSPPPRQTDEIESTVTIPDGHTIIVGGLTRTSHATTHSSIPFIEDIPIIKHLVGTKTSRWNRSTLFIFLRPVILRDDKFRDLKYLSERDTKDSRTLGTLPFSEPLLVR